MKKEIEDLQATIVENVSEIISLYESENEKLTDKVKELEDEINDQDSYIDVDDCDEIKTSLEIIHVHNQTGNLALQQEIDTFLSSIKQKYL